MEMSICSVFARAHAFSQIRLGVSTRSLSLLTRAGARPGSTRRRFTERAQEAANIEAGGATGRPRPPEVAAARDEPRQGPRPPHDTQGRISKES